MSSIANPLLHLTYERAFESLGGEYFDLVTAAEFPRHILRWRNDSVLELLGLDPAQVSDQDLIEALGKFHGDRPLLALRYHGYQFGEYNPRLGDGRGFLYGQLRGQDGELYDLGTKGSGTTPYSRGGDGRLTLKGGVREVLAAEVLHCLGVCTSRCLTMIETGDSLWRGDEPSPTRASVMVRCSRSHIRFGTLERLYHIQRPDLIPPLLDHVIQIYYSYLEPGPDLYLRFYTDLVQRVARLVASWMVAGFCHGVLNTDNMSITGESFDYGPYAFIPTYDPDFTAAYFDYSGRYSYGNQPGVCRWNLQMLQYPLRCVLEPGMMEAALDGFDEHYHQAYTSGLLRRLGFKDLPASLGIDLVVATLRGIAMNKIGYHEFFLHLRSQAQVTGNPEAVCPQGQSWEEWQHLYCQACKLLPPEQIQQTLVTANPRVVPLRPVIEEVWQAIDQRDDWQPFQTLIQQMHS